MKDVKRNIKNVINKIVNIPLKDWNKINERCLSLIHKSLHSDGIQIFKSKYCGFTINLFPNDDTLYASLCSEDLNWFDRVRLKRYYRKVMLFIDNDTQEKEENNKLKRLREVLPKMLED